MAAHRGPNRIPNAPLREAFLASGLSASDVCRMVGWTRVKHTNRSEVSGDTTMLKRTLGLQPSRNLIKGKRYTSWNVTIHIDHAKAICTALGLDFDDLYPDLPTPRSRGGVCVSCGELLLRPVAHRTCGFCVEERALGLVGGSRHGLERAA